jgi:4-alpha-glucanotransferase
VYDWPAMRRRGYRWWTERLRRAADLFDLVRIDHFRGLVAWWGVPAGARSAASGSWRRGPGGAPLLAARRELGELELIAEDLGVITPPVERLRERLGIPGMAVLQFLFGDGSAREAPRPADVADVADPVEAVSAERLLYTGTHDQNTLTGWWQSLESPQRARVEGALRRRKLRASEAPWSLLELAADAPAGVVMMQMQDVLGLGGDARMNTPGRAAGNWRWRMERDAATPRLARRLRQLTAAAGRLP